MKLVNPHFIPPVTKEVAITMVCNENKKKEVIDFSVFRKHPVLKEFSDKKLKNTIKNMGLKIING